MTRWSSPALLLGLGIGRATVALAADPTQAELDLFQNIRVRIEAHKTQWPESVQDALDSIQGEITLTKSFPEGAAASEVILNVRTNLVRWEPGDFSEGDGGYAWICTPSVADRKKTIQCDNRMMLDAGKLARRETDVFNKITNEALLYHELLHAQKMIDALQDMEWLKRVCDNTPEFPLYPTGVVGLKDDEDKANQAHAAIYTEQTRYTIAVAKQERFVVKTETISRAAARNGNFELSIAAKDLNPEGKEFYVMPADNVDSVDDYSDPQAVDQIFRGKLRDQTKDGTFVVFLVP